MLGARHSGKWRQGETGVEERRGVVRGLGEGVAAPRRETAGGGGLGAALPQLTRPSLHSGLRTAACPRPGESHGLCARPPAPGPDL